MLGSRRSQLALLKEELGHTRSLVSEGYAPRNRQLELERQVADANAFIAELVGNTVRSRRSVTDASPACHCQAARIPQGN